MYDLNVFDLNLRYHLIKPQYEKSKMGPRSVHLFDSN